MGLLLIVFGVSGVNVNAEDTDEFIPSVYGVDDKNALFLEIFGTGGLISVHYERMLTEEIAVRGGVGYFSNTKSRGMSFPFEITSLMGRSNGKVELGAGAIYYDVAGDDDGDNFFDIENSGLRGTLYFGYRYTTDEGYVYRIGFTPVFSDSEFYPFSGFSVGATF